MSGQLRARAGPREALCDGCTWRQTCARGAAAQRAGARRARKAAAPGGTPLQVCEEPSVPTTLKGALPRARAVAAQALVTKLLHAWALLHLRFHLVPVPNFLRIYSQLDTYRSRWAQRRQSWGLRHLPRRLARTVPRRRAAHRRAAAQQLVVPRLRHRAPRRRRRPPERLKFGLSPMFFHRM